MRTTIKARVSYSDFQTWSRAPIALRMKHAFEAQGIRFAAYDPDQDREPVPLPPYRMIKSCDGQRLYIEQEQDVPAMGEGRVGD